MAQNVIKMYLAIFLSYPKRRRMLKAGWRRIKDKTLYHLRMKWTSTSATEAIFKRSDKVEVVDDEDRWPELVCLWVSVAVLAVITIVMFAVAYGQ